MRLTTEQKLKSLEIKRLELLIATSLISLLGTVIDNFLLSPEENTIWRTATLVMALLIIFISWKYFSTCVGHARKIKYLESELRTKKSLEE